MYQLRANTMYHLCSVQVLRSADEKSVPGLVGKESSIHNAYLDLIEKAEHFIYIEVFHKIVLKGIKIIAIKFHRTNTSFPLSH